MTVPITVAGVAYTVPSGADSTNWAAQQVLFEQALAAAVNGSITDITELEAAVAALNAFAWTRLTPAGSWSADLVYSKSTQGIVRVRCYNAELGVDDHLGTLPVGFRPPVPAAFVGVIPGGSELVLGSVATNGEIFLSAFDGSTPSNGTSFEITFSTTASPP